MFGINAGGPQCGGKCRDVALIIAEVGRRHVQRKGDVACVVLIFITNVDNADMDAAQGTGTKAAPPLEPVGFTQDVRGVVGPERQFTRIVQPAQLGIGEMLDVGISGDEFGRKERYASCNTATAMGVNGLVVANAVKA